MLELPCAALHVHQHPNTPLQPHQYRGHLAHCPVHTPATHPRSPNLVNYCTQVRLMLVLAPAACCLAGIAAHEALLTLTRSIRGRLAAKAQSPMEGAVNLDGSADKASDAAPAKPELSKRASRKAADGGKVGPGFLW